MYVVLEKQLASPLWRSPQLQQPGPAPSSQTLKVQQAPQVVLRWALEVVQDGTRGPRPVGALRQVAATELQ